MNEARVTCLRVRASGLPDEQRKADLAALGLSKLKQRKHASTQLEALLKRGEQSNPPIVLSECVRTSYPLGAGLVSRHKACASPLRFAK